jgi:hypothetical protein
VSDVAVLLPGLDEGRTLAEETGISVIGEVREETVEIGTEFGARWPGIDHTRQNLW